ncbi:MAG TPA: hypothetical protein VF384_06085 [Planctomycetota bacterium]
MTQDGFESRALQVKNPLQKPARQLLLTFDVDVKGVQGRGLKATLTGGARGAARNAVVSFASPVVSGGAVKLRVRMAKGAATVHRRIWLLDEPPPSKPFTNAMKSRRARLDRYLRPRPRPAPPPGFDPVKARFFFDLDVLTLPPLLAEQATRVPKIAKRLQAIIEVNTHLRSRLEMRAWNTSYGLHFVRELQSEQKIFASAVLLEKLLRGVLASYLRKFPGQDPETVLRDLFVSFAAGDLADERHPDATGTFGAPDGVQFLHFAEFVLLCKLRQVQGQVKDPQAKWEKFWRPVFRALVVATDVFAHVYWNGGKRVDTSYTQRCHVPSRDFREEVCKRHTALAGDLEVVDLFGRIAALVLRDVHLKEWNRAFLVQDALRPE